MKVTRLKPQRVRGGQNGWLWARDRGYRRDWRLAIDQHMRDKLSRPEHHWLDGKPSDE